MAFRFNYTHRERILLSDVSVSVEHGSQPLKVYLVTQLGNYKTFMTSDRVVLEALRRTKSQRKEIGSVGELGEKKAVVFDEFPNGEDVYYRLKIVDSATPIIKGMAEKIQRADKPDRETPMEGILPVQFADPSDGLKEQLWGVSFSPSGPVLLLTPGKIRNKECVKSQEFKALVWPQVLKTVLTYAFLVCGENTPEWAEDWKKFAEAKGAGSPPEWTGDNAIEIFDWINEVVANFSEYAHLGAVEIKNITKEVQS